MYQPVHFATQELIPPVIYNAKGESSLAMMNEGLLRDLDALHDHLNSIRPGTTITINNWHSGGPFSERGFRTLNMTGSPTEPHKFGRAVDFSSPLWTPHEIRQEILANSAKFVYFTRLEQYLDPEHAANHDEIGWVHVDVVPLQNGQTRIHQFIAQA